jgi:hypothetical protein
MGVIRWYRYLRKRHGWSRWECLSCALWLVS